MTGAMLALIPSAETSARLMVTGDGQMEQSQMHCTLFYLGKTEELDDMQRAACQEAVASVAQLYAPFTVRGFAVDIFNPDTPEPCIVLGLSGAALDLVRDQVGETALAELAAPQKKPWIPHITLQHTADFELAAEYVDRVGPVTFDGIAAVFGDEWYEYEFTGDLELVDASLTAAVNSTSWEKLPIADRDTKFAFREATDRLAAKAQSVEQFNSWFFYRDPNKPANNRNSYRLPFADVFADGTVKLVPAAVFSAAAQLSGAHGVASIPADEQAQIRKVIDQIYGQFQTMWDDPRQVPPWNRPPSPSAADEPVIDSETASIDTEEYQVDELIAAVNSAGWSGYPIADTSRAWDAGAASQRLQSWADGDMGKFRKAHLWYDAANADNVTAYKFPIADIVNGHLTIIPRAVNNAKARLNSADIPAGDKTRILGILNRIQRRFEGDNATTASGEEALTAAGAFAPPVSLFQNPGFTGPTKMRVTEVDGYQKVEGHIAQFGVCHRGVRASCVMAPRSQTDYAQFKTGSVLTADAGLVAVGKLTMDTGHATLDQGYIAAASHYDNTGTGVAVVNVGEDQHGIWASGVWLPTVDEAKIVEFRASPISGDWRLVGNSLELVAALAVNTPGFPINEPQYAMRASGVQESLVAAGVLEPDADCGCSLSAAADAEAEKMETAVAALNEEFARLRARYIERQAKSVIDVQLPVR